MKVIDKTKIKQLKWKLCQIMVKSTMCMMKESISVIQG